MNVEASSILLLGNRTRIPHSEFRYFGGLFYFLILMLGKDLRRIYERALRFGLWVECLLAYPWERFHLFNLGVGIKWDPRKKKLFFG